MKPIEVLLMIVFAPVIVAGAVFLLAIAVTLATIDVLRLRA